MPPQATPGTPFTFEIDFSSFAVTASQVPNLVGADFVVGDPPAGLDWDGSAPVDFFFNLDTTKDSGITVSPDPNPLNYNYGFGNTSGLLFSGGFDTLITSETVTLTAVPEPGSALLLLVGLGGLGGLAMRKRSPASTKSRYSQ